MGSSSYPFPPTTGINYSLGESGGARVSISCIITALCLSRADGIFDMMCNLSYTRTHIIGKKVSNPAGFLERAHKNVVTIAIIYSSVLYIMYTWFNGNYYGQHNLIYWEHPLKITHFFKEWQRIQSPGSTRRWRVFVQNYELSVYFAFLKSNRFQTCILGCSHNVLI